MITSLLLFSGWKVGTLPGNAGLSVFSPAVLRYISQEASLLKQKKLDDFNNFFDGCACL